MELLRMSAPTSGMSQHRVTDQVENFTKAAPDKAYHKSAYVLQRVPTSLSDGDLSRDQSYLKPHRQLCQSSNITTVPTQV
jgi:hypothetical protein